MKKFKILSMFILVLTLSGCIENSSEESIVDLEEIIVSQKVKLSGPAWFLEEEYRGQDSTKLENYPFIPKSDSLSFSFTPTVAYEYSGPNKMTLATFYEVYSQDKMLFWGTETTYYVDKNELVLKLKKDGVYILKKYRPGKK